MPDEWIILTGDTDEEITKEVEDICSTIVQPLGRRTSLKAKTAENLSLFL